MLMVFLCQPLMPLIYTATHDTG